MSSINSDIVEFNQHVKTTFEGLRSRGERCDDIMVSLFNGYAAAGDETFVNYVAKKKDEHDDGADMTMQSLMTSALNKYTDLKRQGLWGALSPEQEQIVASSSEVNQIRDRNLTTRPSTRPLEI